MEPSANTSHPSQETPSAPATAADFVLYMPNSVPRRPRPSYAGPLTHEMSPFLPPDSRFVMTGDLTMQYAAHFILNGFLPHLLALPHPHSHILHAISGMHDILYCMQCKLDLARDTRRQFNHQTFRQYMMDLNHALIICLSQEYTVEQFQGILRRYYEAILFAQQGDSIPSEQSSPSSNDMSEQEETSTIDSTEKPENPTMVTTDMANTITDTIPLAPDPQDISPMALPLPQEPESYQEIPHAPIFDPIQREEFDAHPPPISLQDPILTSPPELTDDDLQFLSNLNSEEELLRWLNTDPLNYY